jgi:CTP-dependent riboflavin kinase
VKVLSGEVKRGCGVASKNLSHILDLIQDRTGVSPLVNGTFNLGLKSEYYVLIPDARIEKNEYNGKEFIKLQRCRVGGVQALIMRPNMHIDGHAHGPAHIELLSTFVLRDHLCAKDGDIVDVEVEGDEHWWQGKR